MTTAIFSDPQDQGPVQLHNFGDTIVVRIKLDAGIWAIFGKVVIHNVDRDPQYASAKLAARDGSLTLDLTSIQIPGARSDSPTGSGWAQALSVQGILTLPGEDFVHIACATYKGVAREAQLIAIQVDSAFGSTPPPHLVSLVFDRDLLIWMTEANWSTGTVTLSGPAPPGGMVVQLSSDRSELTMPATVTVAAGTTQTTFRAVLGRILVLHADAHITASSGAVHVTAQLGLDQHLP
jgi:hypothetical protein